LTRGTFSWKNRASAFHGTDLELILRSRGIDAVIITGIATNVCCETTAREAAVRDFRVFFLSDGTATFDIGTISAAELQRATCATLGLLFASADGRRNDREDPERPTALKESPPKYRRVR
jgi:nicotinamidase-related amidase